MRVGETNEHLVELKLKRRNATPLNDRRRFVRGQLATDSRQKYTRRIDAFHRRVFPPVFVAGSVWRNKNAEGKEPRRWGLPRSATRCHQTGFSRRLILAPFRWERDMNFRFRLQDFSRDTEITGKKHIKATRDIKKMKRK